MQDIWVLGVSITPFTRYPPEVDLIDLAHRAARAALGDGDVAFPDVDVLAVGTAYEPNANPAQRLLRQLGQTGIPAHNVVNACATGAAALRWRRWPSPPAKPASGSPSAPRGWARRACSAAPPGRGETGGPAPSPLPGATAPSCRSRDSSAPRRCPASSPTPPPSTPSATASPSSSSPGSRRRTTPTPPSTPGPVPGGVLPRGDHGRRRGGLAEHAADVLPDGRRRGGGAERPYC